MAADATIRLSLLRTRNMAACVPTTSTLYVLSTSLSSSEVRTTITSTILNPVVVRPSRMRLV